MKKFNEENKESKQPEFKFKDQVLDREDSVWLIYEYFKYRILVLGDDVALEGFLLYGCGLSDWDDTGLQEALKEVARRAEEIETWPRFNLHTELEKISGRKSTKAD